MLAKNTLLSLSISFILARATRAQYACPSIPLCCQYVVDSLTPNVTSVMSQEGIAPTSVDVVFPVGINCVPIEDPPADYILLCTSPRKQVCCEYNKWGGKIAFGCEPDPPILTA
ncbi:hypothetical protein HYDPIDRAFT_112627 [Hydnomerulius pinastri MD-312]|uniref:Hydrophobin n=1 Tax=Hydnomerulius pinastri MD-312 TaxID=994086 RepID=A0A0C9W8Y5_9AGAM|nr:hypothetical protein HYDPIDRAFT_112627 [Hydnomerulius pinastri MD-312]